jgi:hypothetical protein
MRRAPRDVELFSRRAEFREGAQGVAPIRLRDDGDSQAIFTTKWNSITHDGTALGWAGPSPFLTA